MEERLQKVVARVCGISRRHAEEWIREGLICVNGDIAQLGCKIDCRRDTLVVENKKINPSLLQAQTNSEVWMLNKPKGVICTHSDPFSTNTLQDLVPKPLHNQHWMFVGRLDKDSEGLLLLTNDGELANKIAHPSSGILKTYRVQVDHPIDENMIPQLRQGKVCEGEFLFFSSVRIVNSRKMDVCLSQGKKREIRRLLASFDYEVVKLKRWKIGELVLDKRLMPGQSRRLSSHEIKLIFKTKLQ